MIRLTTLGLRAAVAALVLVCVFTAGLLSPGPLRGGPADGSRPSLDGIWVGVELIRDDGRVSASEKEGLRMVIKGNRCKEFSDNDPIPDWEATIRLNPQARPKQIDFTFVAPDCLKGRRLSGIYELDGERLKLALPLTPGEPRPAAFDGRGRTQVLVLQRQGPRDEKDRPNPSAQREALERQIEALQGLIEKAKATEQEVLQEARMAEGGTSRVFLLATAKQFGDLAKELAREVKKLQQELRQLETAGNRK